jgi:predicted ATPase
MLRAELDGALRGEGRLVVLLGEPGIGKTRTATALASEARERGAAVVWGRCHESEGAPAYWPWVQALTAYVKDTEREPVSPLAREPVDREHSDQRTREIEALLPALRAGTGLSDAHEAPDRARFELFDRVVTALAPAARAQPLLIILDDLHWADIGSLRLLEFVACELGTMPLFLLGTAREAELARQTDAAALLSAVVRLGRGLTLAGLSGPEVRDLLTDRLGRAPEDGLVNDVVGLSDGNPFFVIEMLHLLDARAETAPRKHGPLALPPGVQELLRRRLDPLPSPTRQLLEIAAVVGRDFDLAPLAAVLDEAADALLDRLAPALDAGIVREVAGALQRYAFTHALMRETVYTLLAPKARIALHAAVGAALEAAVPRDDVERSALAHHFFAAAQGGDPSKAIRYACEAGERALDVLAFEEAVRQF